MKISKQQRRSLIDYSIMAALLAIAILILEFDHHPF